MALGPGSYVIGRDDDCDIILSDVMVEPKQIRLDFRAGRVVVRGLAGLVYIDGKPLETAEKEIKSFQYVTLGSTYFTLGPATEAWPPNALKPLPALEQPIRHTPPVAALSLPKNQGAAKARGELAGATPGRKRFIHPSLVLTIMALVLAGAGGFLDWQQSAPVLAAAAPPTLDQVQAQVDATLNKLHFASNVRSSIEDPVLIVSGSVAHNNDLRLLRNALAPWQSQISFSVVSDDQSLNDTREILGALNSGLNAELIDNQVVISGYAGSDAQFQELRAILAQDLPGNFHLSFNVITNESAAQSATELVSQAGLGDAIAITPTAKGIVANGKIDSNAEILWNRIRRSIAKNLPMLPTLENSVTVLAPDASGKDDNSIDSICLGPIPWFRLHNGQTCFNGATLPGGWTVTSIQPDQVELTNNGTVRLIKLGSAVSQNSDSSLTPPPESVNSPFLIK